MGDESIDRGPVNRNAADARTVLSRATELAKSEAVNQQAEAAACRLLETVAIEAVRLGFLVRLESNQVLVGSGNEAGRVSGVRARYMNRGFQVEGEELPLTYDPAAACFVTPEGGTGTAPLGDGPQSAAQVVCEAIVDALKKA